jgi:superfamily I DNA/RNA helicase
MGDELFTYVPGALDGTAAPPSPAPAAVPTPAPAPRQRPWSPQQRAIFDWFRSGRGNLVVRARAGTGKTTSIIEAIDHAPEDRILLAAFNKRIAVELQARLANPLAEARTLHSLGFGFVRQSWKGVKVDKDRGWRLAEAAVATAGAKRLGRRVVLLVKELAAKAKGACPDPTSEELVDLAYEHDLDPGPSLEAQGFDVERLADATRVAMELALEHDGTVDFDDMVFVPVRKGWARPLYGLVVVDECQDLNRAQLALALAVCRPGGRIAVVGDDRQAVYRFRGADSGSLDRLKKELAAEELPLTVTYRCPNAVVALAAKLVPDFTAAESAPEGKASLAGYEEMIADARPGDFVLSRVNAPLMRACLRLLRAGQPAMVEGKEIGAGLLAIVKEVGGRSVADFQTRLADWAEKRIERLEEARAAGQWSAQRKIDHVEDQAETLDAIAEACKSASEIEAKLRALFEDVGEKTDRIVLSSVHKAKGLERDRVWGLVDTLYAHGKTEDQEEKNIEYVMVTRAKREFVAVRGTGR